MWRKSCLNLTPIFAVLFVTTAAFAAKTTFEDGYEGWVVEYGPSEIDTDGGNPAPCMRCQELDVILDGVEFANSANRDFVCDYTATPQVDFTIDTYTTLLADASGNPSGRELVIELRDYDDAPEGYEYVAVWAIVGELSSFYPGWQTWTATIEDTSVTECPEGWYGWGAEDPETHEMILPEDRTFTDVLANMDAIAVTTFVPGCLYTAVSFDVSFDNIGVTYVPEPATLAFFLVGGLACVSRRR